ncbi:hypothetical protein ABT299_34600 [Spirillospora sp. NPDC000708]
MSEPISLEVGVAQGCAVNGPHLVVLVRAGSFFCGGIVVERPEQDAA